MEIVITWYKDSMYDQVISLFETEYRVNRQEFETLFTRFYFAPFQKDKCLLIVAMDGETVAGFQSFFYWPYQLSGNTFASYQSGNSIVHPGYRGKGIFQKMLAFIDQENKTIGIDLLMGFPVEASFKNFIKDKWQNILNLDWYIKICNPLGFLNTTLEKRKGFEKGYAYPCNQNNKALLRLNTTHDFIAWRKQYTAGNGYSYTFEKNGHTIIFHLKQNKRKKILNELIIGNILFSSTASEQFLPEALKALNTTIRNSCSAHFISVALNDNCANTVKQSCLNTGFKKTEKSIHFIVKPFTANAAFTDAQKWELYRSDIDTW